MLRLGLSQMQALPRLLPRPPPLLPRRPPPLLPRRPPRHSCITPSSSLAAAAAAAALAATAMHQAAGLAQAQEAERGSKPQPPPVITKAEEYIKGVKIYNIGILEDPIPGEKRGRGIQHLTSSYFIYDMGVFINRNFSSMQTMIQYAYERSHDRPGFDYRYYTNVSNALFLKAEAEGLRTRDGRDFFLMAAWLAMAAAEVDGFQFRGGKYTPEQRAAQREMFYQKYLSPDVVWDPDEADDPQVEQRLGKFAIECCRIDLIPSLALERLGIHNELCAMKWTHPTTWLKEGFQVSGRIDSMKRHFESIHACDQSEDHMAHLIWGFMAVVHVVAVFPQMNDLADYEVLRRQNVRSADAETRALVGDGGFRPAAVQQYYVESRPLQPAVAHDQIETGRNAHNSPTDQGNASVTPPR